jgi:hypothetical protein
MKDLQHVFSLYLLPMHFPDLIHIDFAVARSSGKFDKAPSAQVAFILVNVRGTFQCDR